MSSVTLTPKAKGPGETAQEFLAEMDRKRTRGGVGAKPKAKPPARPQDARAPQPVGVVIRARPEWKTWLEELAAAERVSVSDLVDIAVTRLARAEGRPEPPRRLPSA